jgi:hypothetical protein
MAKPRALYSLRLHFNVHLDAGSTTGEHFENVRRAALMAVILRIAFGVCFASKDMAFVGGYWQWYSVTSSDFEITHCRSTKHEVGLLQVGIRNRKQQGCGDMHLSN